MPFPSQTPSQGAGGTSNGEEITLQSSVLAAGTPVCTKQFAKGPGQYEEMKSVMQCYSISFSHSVLAVTQKKPKLCGLTCSNPDIPYEAT